MSENSDKELKPCPFCVGKAHLLTSNGSFLVECSICLTDFLNGPVGIGWYRSEKDAATDWNDRPSERALLTKLEAAELELIKPLPIGELLHRLEGQTYRKWYDDDELNKWRERAEAAEARLLVPVKLPTDEIGEAASFVSDAEVIPVSIVIELIKVAGYPVEGGE
ncbi:Uncharacterised protein [Yersinia frederiksenii]|nr:Uncharacterised protein [Yersinia frederiksenii]